MGFYFFTKNKGGPLLLAVIAADIIWAGMRVFTSKQSLPLSYELETVFILLFVFILVSAPGLLLTYFLLSAEYGTPVRLWASITWATLIASLSLFFMNRFGDFPSPFPDSIVLGVMAGTFYYFLARQREKKDSLSKKK